MKSRIIIFILLLLSGCGYTTGSLVPSHIKNVYVETFINKTDEPNIEVDITNAIKDRFVVDSSLDIANSKEDADSMLKGEIVNYDLEPLSYANNDEINEYELILTVNVSYIDLVNNKVLWQEKNYKADSTYYSTQNQQRYGSTDLDKSQLLINASKELARRLVDHVVEGW